MTNKEDMEAKKITMTLEFPPSVNHLLFSGRNKRYLSPVARRYYALAIANKVPPEMMLQGRLKLHMIIYPPDKRRRDLDNHIKAPIDFLMHSKVFEDDSQIDELIVVRGPVKKPGSVQVTVEEFIC